MILLFQGVLGKAGNPGTVGLQGSNVSVNYVVMVTLNAPHMY